MSDTKEGLANDSLESIAAVGVPSQHLAQTANDAEPKKRLGRLEPVDLREFG